MSELAEVVGTDDEVVETVEAEEVSMEDALNEALDGLDGSDEESTDETTETAEADESKDRNPDGTFKAKTEGELDDQTDDPDKAKAEQAENPETKAVEPEIVNGRDITKAPTTWKAEAQAKYNELPKEVRAEIHRREEDMFRGIEQYKTAASFGTDIAKQLQPHREFLEKYQYTPQHLLHSVVEFERVMRGDSRDDKIGLLQKIAKTYGLISETDDQGNAVTPDPRYEALETKYKNLETKLTETEQTRQREAVKQEWESFKADPKHAMVSMVQGEMAQLISSKQAGDLDTAYAMAVLNNDQALQSLTAEMEFIGQVKDDVLKEIQLGQGADLKSAYDKVVWINPVTRAKLISRQNETERKQAAEKAAAARKASRTNVTPRATPRGKTSGKGTTEDALNAALDEMGLA